MNYFKVAVISAVTAIIVTVSVVCILYVTLIAAMNGWS